MPLQIGARDVAFPFLNNLSFWLTVAGAVLVMISLFIGEFARTGWLGYAPLSEKAFSTGYRRRLLSLVAADRGHRHDAVGGQHGGDHHQDARARHDDDEDAVFTWTALCSNVLAIAIFPALTAAFFLLMLDRYSAPPSSPTISAATR
jgi:cytochrome o ubiquinol oxidase subunit 1